MSFKSELIYDINHIIKEIDDVETEELIEISESVKKFYYLLFTEIDYRKSLK
jgi:hypothetical protein